jgi:3-isopropylmalate/(R)-2-methylmalate dehydratase large subunit
MPSTLFDKIWDAHEVAPGLLYVDLHLVHEVTSPQAFDGLRLAGRDGPPPRRTLATADHNVPTDGTPVGRAIRAELSREPRSRRSSATARSSGIPRLLAGLEPQGIVHVIGPSSGVTQPA